MERRCAPLATAAQKILSRAHSEAPFDGAAVEHAAADTLTDEDAGEGVRQSKNSAEHEWPLATHLDLHPGTRRATAVSRFRVLRHHTLVSALFSDGPGRKPVVWQAPGGKDHTGTGRLVLEHVATAVELKTTDVEAVNVQAIERHEHRRRAVLVRRAVEQVELADEILIEHADLLDACAESRNKQLRALVLVALHTGLRKGELLGLTWEQVEFARGVIRLGRQTKSGKGRDVPINQVVYGALAPLRSAAGGVDATGRVWGDVVKIDTAHKRRAGPGEDPRCET